MNHIDTFYTYIATEHFGMSDVIANCQPWLNTTDILNFYTPDVENYRVLVDHTFTFLWLILVAEGYEK